VLLTVPEKSRQGFAFIFEDEDRRQFTPVTARYRVHNPETEVELVPWTTVTPAGTVNIVVPASAHQIADDTVAYELRVITVQSDYDTDDQLSQDRTYRVQNLSGFQ
jgi:hypothetical protein